MTSPAVKLGCVGAGNMAEALVRGVLRAGLLTPGQILVSDPQPARRDLFTGALGVQAVDDNLACAGAEALLLAVKPQTMGAVLTQLAGHVEDRTVVISIAAGVRTATIHAGLGGRGRVVRVMPNTPMLVGAGVSGLCPGPGATPADVEAVERLFAACGATARVAEADIDAVTAVSGSGPAYVFYLVEAMIAAGLAEGLDEAVAHLLAVETCRGAAELLRATGQTPQALRAQVTSPNGTTQAAVEVLDAAGVKDACIRAVRRAAQRSRELGR